MKNSLKRTTSPKRKVTKVWENYWRQEKPIGYLIHHSDRDIKNNIISNLALVTRKLHAKIHNVGETTKPETKLIQEYIAWCKKRGFNQTKMAVIVGRSRSWSSLIVSGKIKSLNFDTRNQIISILGR